MIGRHRKRDPGRLDLDLGPREPPFHRLLRDEEPARDLLRSQATERTKRQRHLGLERKCWMAACEDQLEALVLDRRIVVEFVHRRLRNLEQSSLLSQCPLPADAVDGSVMGTRVQPGAGVARNAIAGPPFGGDRECLLSGLLGEIEVAEETDQRGEHPAPLLAEDLLQQR